MTTKKKKKAPRNQERRTPKWYYDGLVSVFGKFTLDAAATAKDALCKRFLTKEKNGLTTPWSGRVFCNPPFAQSDLWVKKAYEEMAHRRVESVLVLPVGCSQLWYQKYAVYGMVYVPNRRINFDLPAGTPTDRADRDTMVVHFDPAHLAHREIEQAHKGTSWDVRVLDVRQWMPVKSKKVLAKKKKAKTRARKN